MTTIVSLFLPFKSDPTICKNIQISVVSIQHAWTRLRVSRAWLSDVFPLFPIEKWHTFYVSFVVTIVKWQLIMVAFNSRTSSIWQLQHQRYLPVGAQSQYLCCPQAVGETAKTPDQVPAGQTSAPASVVSDLLFWWFGRSTPTVRRQEVVQVISKRVKVTMQTGRKVIPKFSFAENYQKNWKGSPSWRLMEGKWRRGGLRPGRVSTKIAAAYMMHKQIKCTNRR